MKVIRKILRFLFCSAQEVYKLRWDYIRAMMREDYQEADLIKQQLDILMRS